MLDPVVIGVIGHRPNRLPVAARPAMAADVADLLRRIAAAAGPRRVILLSSLAAGADQIAAQAALNRGFALAAILPFTCEDYSTDFIDPASKAAFGALLAEAHKVDILPGTRADAGAAYEAAGLALLARSALVIAVWDGGPSGGRGGTTEMIAAAASLHKTVLWVDATGKQRPTVHCGPISSVDDAIDHLF